MPHRPAVAVLLALALALTACGGSEQPPAEPTGRGPANTEPTAPTARPDLRFTQTGEVAGEKGTKLKMTPVAVMYTKGAKESDAPANGWFAVIAIRAEATAGPDNIPAPITGFGLYWRGEETTLDGSEGNATTTAWVGTVNEFSNVPMEPGHPEMAIETFDIPAKGGRLVYINPDSTIIAWQLPSENTGNQKLFKRVHERITEFGGERPA